MLEGFPGSGKSTTAQWLANALTRAGRRARWVRLAMPKLVIDPAATWADRRRTIAAFVGIGAASDAVVEPEDLARYGGMYRARDGRQVARIELANGGLVVDRLVWPRNRLLPKARGVFDVEGWPYEMTFAGDGGSFTLTGPTLGWGGPPRAFDRAGD